MIIGILSLTAFISAIIAIIFWQQYNIRMFAVFKSLTTILIIIMALIIHHNSASTYSITIIYSLLASLIGDIFLINKKYFLYGLSCFFLAHIGFTIGFISLFGFSINVIALAILMLIGILYFLFLLNDLRKHKVPVALYISAIIVMNWQGINLILHDQSFVYFGIAVATILFSVSDSIIAFNKYNRSFKVAEILILSTYWIAIYIFTLAGLFI